MSVDKYGHYSETPKKWIEWSGTLDEENTTGDKVNDILKISVWGWTNPRARWIIDAVENWENWELNFN